MSSSKPFRDLKFCCTSVPSDLRQDISEKIKVMGGVYCNNLMSDVNVLIVGDRNTDKFRFSVQKRFDIVFVAPQTVLALHARWLEGENIVESVVEGEQGKEGKEVPAVQYLRFVPRLKPFEGLSVCVSRISDSIVSKTEVAHLVNENGGVSTDSLTVNTDFLVTTETTGKRYLKAVEWKIPVVHPQWARDSVRRGAVLDGTYYDVSKARDFTESAKKACLVWDEIKRFGDERAAVEQSRSRKRRRLLDDLGAKGDRSNEHNSGDNEDDYIYEKNDNDEIRQTKKNKSSLSAWDSIINNSFTRSQSENAQNKPQRGTTRADRNDGANTIEDGRRTATPTKSKKLLFKGLRFMIRGFDAKQTNTLIRIIHSHSGQVDTFKKEQLSKSDYVLVPHNVADRSALDEVVQLASRESSPLPKIVTEWFIERSLYYNAIKNDFWGRPMHLAEPFHMLSRGPGLAKQNKIRASISGFSGIELLHLEKLLGSLSIAIDFSDRLTKATSLLIINTSLIGLNETNSKPLFENNAPEVQQLLRDVECNKLSLQSMKKKLIFCQTHQIPIYAPNFLFKMFVAVHGHNEGHDNVDRDTVATLSDLRWCVFFPKRLKRQGNAPSDNALVSFAHGHYKNKEHDNGGSLLNNNDDEDDEDSGAKGSRRLGWGKLSGKASESSLNQPSNPPSNGALKTGDLSHNAHSSNGKSLLEGHNGGDDAEDNEDGLGEDKFGEQAEEPVGTQIGYGKLKRSDDFRRSRQTNIG